jgi:hypothetical protein
MKGGCFRLLLSTILISSWAFADTPGTCNPAPSCTTAQTCTASPCIVQLQRSGSSVSMTVNGAVTTLFCTDGNAVQWQVVDTSSSSFADIRFAAGSSPYPTASVQADSLTPASPAFNANASGCYQFALADCPASSGGGNCGYADPKVVIGQATKRHHPHKPKPTPQQ